MTEKPEQRDFAQAFADSKRLEFIIAKQVCLLHTAGGYSVVIESLETLETIVYPAFRDARAALDDAMTKEGEL